ncbi:MAG: adenylosuccinate lyase [bacterium]|nr:adenylosuccinate lyase [bacterium]
MISRYSRKEMVSVWEEENKFQKWLDVELAVCDAWEKLGKIPNGTTKRITHKAGFSIDRIKAIESEVKHDVIAFLTAVAETVGPDSRFIHLGMTSSDVLDTALALQMKEAGLLILQDLKALLLVLKKQAKKYKNTLMIGRSHGIHGEPITLGLKFAIWYEETKRNIRRMENAVDVISFGKISGAMGNYAHLDPRVEKYVCNKLQLKPAPVSNQIIQRDRHAEYLSALAITASSLDKFATEVRNLQRTDIGEAEEPFTSGQKGSSAMPHKKNPITCEQVSGLARIVRSNAQAGFENVILWHERDISHSSVERVILPDSTILVDYMLNKMINVLGNLRVYPDRMLKNIGQNKGIIFSQRLLLKLIDKGLTREESYRLIQSSALKTQDSSDSFLNEILQNENVKKYLSDKEIKDCFDLKYYLKNNDHIFKQVGI